MKSPNVGYLDTLESVYKYPTKKEFNLDNYSNHNLQNSSPIHHKLFQHFHYHRMGLTPHHQLKKFGELVVIICLGNGAICSPQPNF